MFKFKSFRSTTANEGSKRGSTSTIDTTGRLTDPSIEIDDPLLLRLNHQRQLQDEKSNRNDSEVFIGWEQEKDPFDLGSTSSENDEEGCSNNITTDEELSLSLFNMNTKSQQEEDEKVNFLGWGEGSSSDMEDTKSPELLVRELSIRGGLSDSIGNHISPQQKSEECISDIDLPSLIGSASRLRSESIGENTCDESSGAEKASITLSTMNDSDQKSDQDRPKVFRCSTKQGDEVIRSPMPRRDYMFRRSTTSGSNHSQSSCRLSGDSDCDSRSSHRIIRRRQSFSNLLSSSLRNLRPDNLAASFRSFEPEIEPLASRKRSFKMESTDKEEECPRLQQLKEQSTAELHNELVRIQVQCKSNLESSWAEAERIRQSNDDLDEKISRLKSKLEMAKAVAVATASESNRGSPMQESCVMSTVSGGVHPMKKLQARNFSSTALNTLFGTNFNDDDASNIMSRSVSDGRVEPKKPRGRRRTFMGDLGHGFRIKKNGSDTCDNSSYISGGSGLGMAIDDSSERKEALSGFYRQCFDENRSEAGSIICQSLSREEWEQNSHTGSHVTADNDNVSDIRSAIDSLQSSVNMPPTNKHTIFEAEAIKLQLEELQEQLSARTDQIEQLKAALGKQNSDIKSCCDTISKSVEDAKKLRELETSTLHDLSDFNRCFRAIDGKLQTIEAIAYDMKCALDESKKITSFEDVQLCSSQLSEAKESVSEDIDRCCILDMLNGPAAFQHYQDCRERIVTNIYRIDFLEADLWNHLVKIRLLIEQGGDDEGTQTTESSMASERRALERVFVEAIIPHVHLAHIIKNNLLMAFRDNVKMLKWWNHVIDAMEHFRPPDSIAPCIDFVSKEPSLLLKKDMYVLRRIHDVTSEYLEDIKADIKQECVSFRSKIERAGLESFDISGVSLDNTKLGRKQKSLFQKNDLQSNTFKSRMLEKGRAIAKKDKFLKLHAYRLESLHSRANKEITSQLEILDKLQRQVQIFSNKMVEQDSLLKSLTETHEKKVKRLLRFQKTTGDNTMSITEA